MIPGSNRPTETEPRLGHYKTFASYRGCHHSSWRDRHLHMKYMQDACVFRGLDLHSLSPTEILTAKRLCFRQLHYLLSHYVGTMFHAVPTTHLYQVFYVGASSRGTNQSMPLLGIIMPSEFYHFSG
jgi:hypothetical protein